MHCHVENFFSVPTVVHIVSQRKAVGLKQNVCLSRHFCNCNSSNVVIIFVSSIFLRQINHGWGWSAPYRSPFCPIDSHGQLSWAPRCYCWCFGCLFPKPWGLGPQYSLGTRACFCICSRGPWGLGPHFRTLTCVTLHDSYWQALNPLPHFSHGTCCGVVFISWVGSINSHLSTMSHRTSQLNHLPGLACDFETFIVFGKNSVKEEIRTKYFYLMVVANCNANCYWLLLLLLFFFFIRIQGWFCRDTEGFMR